MTKEHLPEWEAYKTHLTELMNQQGLDDETKRIYEVRIASLDRLLGSIEND